VNPPKLLDQVRDAIRLRHYSIRTEEAYIQWIKRYILSIIRNIPAAWGRLKLPPFSATSL
jgi:hypothetical protein